MFWMKNFIVKFVSFAFRRLLLRFPTQTNRYQLSSLRIKLCNFSGRQHTLHIIYSTLMQTNVQHLRYAEFAKIDAFHVTCHEPRHTQQKRKVHRRNS